MTARPQRPAPRPSATVVVLREAAARPEVLLVKRHARTAFGTAYAFPGGVLEPADRDAHAYCAGRDAARAGAALGVRQHALDYYSAAIRELFEETGVLLAHGPGGDWAGTESSQPALDAERQRLNHGESDWAHVLERREWSLACEALSYFAHWITPAARTRRFTTRFFLATLPPGQRARHDGGELTDSRWMTAAAALDAGKAERIVLPPPTRATLADLAAFDSVAAAVAWAGEKEAAGVESCLPVVVGEGGDERLLMPGDPDYARAAAGDREEPA